VWHFYQIFFDPDVYPMNWAWWDGKMSFEHYREEHELDTATLLEAARKEQQLQAVDITELGQSPEHGPAEKREGEAAEHIVLTPRDP
jgi:hypothetical protein